MFLISSILCLVSPLYNTWYHFQFVTSLERVATSHKQSIVSLEQTLTKGLIELNWKWYVYAAVTATVTTAVILVTQSWGQFILKNLSAGFITEHSICPLVPFPFSAKTMTNSKTLYEVHESSLLCMFLKLQTLSALKNSEDWEKPLMC